MKKIKLIHFLSVLCFTLFSVAGMAQTFVGGGNPQPIPPSGTVGCCTESVADVTASGVIGTNATLDMVLINLTHTFDADLDISLISPSGTSWDLSSDNGGSGDNYINTEFVDGCPPITTGTPPFTGCFEAEQGPFAVGFDGEEINGDWTLSINDDVGGDSGTLLDFEITFTVTAPPPPTVAVVELPVQFCVQQTSQRAQIHFLHVKHM